MSGNFEKHMRLSDELYETLVFVYRENRIFLSLLFLSRFRIDNNVEDTELNVEAAHSELLKYFQNISSNRWLIIKIFFVLIVFFIIFVVFMA